MRVKAVNILRSFALNAQYALCRRKRARTVDRMAQENRAPISILFYHRVANRIPNDWTISCDRFVRHIEYCRSNFEIISLCEAQHRLRTGQSPRPAVAITFDDGYAENMEFAIPWLVRNQIPCSYFVTTDHVRTGRPFAHDVRAGQPLAVNTIAEIRSAADSGVDIGVHSATHVDFSTLTTRRELEYEIVDAKMDLEMMIGHRVNYFAVPFGMPQHLRPSVIQTVRDCGLSGICSAYGAYNLIGNDPFHIRRIHGDTDFARLRNWLSFDERKIRLEPALPTEDELLIDDHWESDFAATQTFDDANLIPQSAVQSY